MRYIIVADVHGCYHELRSLVEQLNVQPEDKLISIGDLLHKGPYEQECVRFVMENFDECILGNHEEKQIRFEGHHAREIETGKKNPMRHVEDYKPLPPEQVKWIRENCVLFLEIEAGERKFLLVHGGIEPRVRSLPENNLFSNKNKKGHFWNALRTRYVDPDGHMVMLGKETEEDVYWAEVYDGRFGHVIFGHQPFLNRLSPREFPHATAIDLGAVYGNCLCAYIIDGDTGETDWFCVPSEEKYQLHRTETGSTNPVPE